MAIALSLPMIHPLFTQYNEDLGNRLNAGCPADDFATYGEAVAQAIAAMVAATGTAESPRAYAEMVVQRLLSGTSLRQKLLETKSLHVELSGSRIVYQKRWFEANPEKLLSLFDLLGEFADVLNRME